MHRFLINVYIVFILLLTQFDFEINKTTYAHRSKMNTSCGIDKSPFQAVYEGWSKIEYFPWMGYLMYPDYPDELSTAVVLVSKQLAIAAANEIDKLPKDEFRFRSRVILGHNCSGAAFKVKEYSYHPEYKRTSFNELALIQLDVDDNVLELRPICPPPTHFIDPEFYAMSFSNDCKDSRIRVHKMKYVDIRECKKFYTRTGLNIKSLWPKHTACAKALDKVPCVWRSGTVLVVHQGGRWLLLGFGVYGPGCSEPARFIDYGMYHSWVKTSITRMGRPAITRLGPGHVIMRRSLARIQRFGPCDIEEMTTEIYTDLTNVTIIPETDPSPLMYRTKQIRYNVTLYTNVDYSCVSFTVVYVGGIEEQPYIHLRRWCAGPKSMCHDFDILQIDFFVEVYFAMSAIFKMAAYGKQPEIIHPPSAILHANNWTRTKPPIARDSKNLTIESPNWYLP